MGPSCSRIERVPLGVSFKLDRRTTLSLSLAIVISAVLLYLSLRGIDFAQLGKTLRSARFAPLGWAALLNLLALWLRSYRWRVLLNANTVLPITPIFWANSIGYLGNNVLPARMGEFMRVEAIKRAFSISRSYVLATAFVERVMDAGVLVLLTSIALLAIPDLPEWLHKASTPLGLASGVGILVLFLLPHAESTVQQLLVKIPALSQIASRFLEGLRSLHAWGRSIQFLALTLMIWPLDSFIGVLIGQSIGFDLPFTTSMIVLAALGLSSAIPSTPGYVGVFQFVAVNVLKPFGVEAETAIAWILLYQAVGYLIQTSCGLLGLMVLSQRFDGKAQESPQPSASVAP